MLDFFIASFQYIGRLQIIVMLRGSICKDVMSQLLPSPMTTLVIDN